MTIRRRIAVSEPGSIGMNAIGAVFFILAIAITRYAPHYSKEVSEFWRVFSTAMGLGVLYTSIRILRSFALMRRPLFVFEIFVAVLFAVALMVAGVLWAFTMKVDEPSAT